MENVMRELMLGNKAVARGMYEAGCKVISSYPGTPQRLLQAIRKGITFTENFK